MTSPATEHFLGKKMQAHCEWARDNVTTLTFRSAEQIERLIRVAKDEMKVQALLLGLIICANSMFLTYRVTFELFGGPVSFWTGVAIASAVGLACVLIANFVGTVMFHRKIRQLAETTMESSSLSHD